MKVTTDIVPFSEENCICLNYIPGANIQFKTYDHVDNTLTICANAEGLQFLAKVCLTLAQSDMPKGSHIHFDGFDFVHGSNFDFTIERSDQ